MKVKEKSKHKNDYRPHRRRLVYAAVAGLSLLVGIIGTMFLMPPKEVPYAVNGVIVDTTPTGIFYVIFASEDIPCGTVITPDLVIRTLPEQIVVPGHYPSLPIWQTYNDPELTMLYNGMARYDLPRGARISFQDIVPQDDPDFVCPTPESNSES